MATPAHRIDSHTHGASGDDVVVAPEPLWEVPQHTQHHTMGRIAHVVSVVWLLWAPASQPPFHDTTIEKRRVFARRRYAGLGWSLCLLDVRRRELRRKSKVHGFNFWCDGVRNAKKNISCNVMTTMKILSNTNSRVLFPMVSSEFAVNQYSDFYYINELLASTVHACTLKNKEIPTESDELQDPRSWSLSHHGATAEQR